MREREEETGTGNERLVVVVPRCKSRRKLSSFLVTSVYLRLQESSHLQFDTPIYIYIIYVYSHTLSLFSIPMICVVCVVTRGRYGPYSLSWFNLCFSFSLLFDVWILSSLLLSHPTGSFHTSNKTLLPSSASVPLMLPFTRDASSHRHGHQSKLELYTRTCLHYLFIYHSSVYLSIHLSSVCLCISLSAFTVPIYLSLCLCSCLLPWYMGRGRRELPQERETMCEYLWGGLGLLEQQK